MTETEIDYEGLAQSALRGVVRTVLARVAEGDKLPGNHHFYISFNTNGEGVSVSKRLREQYPEEMTIVLQHRYWDLQVHDDRFEVKLTFNSIPERLVVPFAAIKVFFDPSVPYGLQFESAGPIAADKLPAGDAPAHRQSPAKSAIQKRPRPTAVKPSAVSPSSLKPNSAKATGVDRISASPAAEPPLDKRTFGASGAPPQSAEPTQLPRPAAAAAAPLPTADASPEPPAPEAKPPGQVVRLDAFRKK